MNDKNIDRKSMIRLNPNLTHNISRSLQSSKIHRALAISLIFLSCVLLAVSFMLFTNKTNKTLEEQAQAQLLDVSQINRENIEYVVKSRLKNLATFAKAIEYYDGFSDKDLRASFASECEVMNYVSMAVSTPDGVSYRNDESTDNVFHREYFKTAMQGQANVSQVLSSIKDGRPIVVFAVPVYDKNKSIIGVLRAVQLAEVLGESSVPSNGYEHGFNQVVRKNGELVLSDNASASIDGAQYNYFNHFKNDNTAKSEIQKEMEQGKSGVHKFKSKDGSTYLTSYSPIPSWNDWYMISVVPQNSIMQKTYSILDSAYVLIWVIIGILLVLFSYILYIKYTTRKTIEYLAYTDPLTGIRCWEKFAIDAQDVLKKNKGKNYAYVCTNILNFKYVNDILGFEAGNSLLQHVAQSLKKSLADDEPCTRINADRFAFIIEYTTDKLLIKRISDINKQICMFKTSEDKPFQISNHYGIYKIKDKSYSIISIGDRALLALQDIRDSKETNFSFYNSVIRETVVYEKELENDMQSALDNKEFLVYLQPKFNLTKNEIIGAEALVRWNHSTKGLIPPMKFIKLFESNGFITKLDLYMFEESCKLLRRWIDSGVKPVPISVNLSKVHIYNQNIAEELYCTVLRYNIPPQLVEIELTESMDFENVALLLATISRLKQFSFTISLDDFGAGYSSLNLLKNIPVDILKIDREFFSQASDEKRGRQVIASIIEMAKHLDMKTVAEGVEYKEQADFLTSINCDYVQGFYFSRPIPVSEFEEKYVYADSIDFDLVKDALK